MFAIKETSFIYPGRLINHYDIKNEKITIKTIKERLIISQKKKDFKMYLLPTKLDNKNIKNFKPWNMLHFN